MNLPESDLEYCVRAFTRIAALCDRLDLAAPERLRQVREQAKEAIGRERGDEEAIQQLKATVVEMRNKGLAMGDAQAELAQLRVQLRTTEGALREMQAQAQATDLHPDRFAALIRFEDLGAVLLDDADEADVIARAQRAALALAKRCARELDAEERERRSKATVLELLER